MSRHPHHDAHMGVVIIVIALLIGATIWPCTEIVSPPCCTVQAP